MDTVSPLAKSAISTILGTGISQKAQELQTYPPQSSQTLPMSSIVETSASHSTSVEALDSETPPQQSAVGKTCFVALVSLSARKLLAIKSFG